MFSEWKNVTHEDSKQAHQQGTSVVTCTGFALFIRWRCCLESEWSYKVKSVWCIQGEKCEWLFKVQNMTVVAPVKSNLSNPTTAG